MSVIKKIFVDNLPLRMSYPYASIKKHPGRYFYSLYFLFLIAAGRNGRAQENLPAIKTTSSRTNDTTAIMHMVNSGLDLMGRHTDSAISLLHQALDNSRRSIYDDGSGMSLFGLALVYSEINNNDTAFKLYTQSLRYLKKSVAYRHMVPATYSNIGYIFYFKGDYTRAIHYYDSAVQISRSINNPASKKYAAITLNSIAAIHMRLDRPERSLYYLKQVEQIARENGFRNELAIALSNMGNIYMNNGDYVKSEEHYQKGLQLYAGDQDIEGASMMATMKSGYATLKLKQGKAREAIQLLKAVEATNSRFRLENTSIIPAFTMGSAYLQLKQYKPAETYLLKALNEAVALQVQDNRDDIHKGLAALYEATGQYKKALYHFRLYEQLKDSLLNKEKAKDIGEVDARYRSAEQARDIARKQLQISRQQNRLNNQKFWIAGILATAAALTLFFTGLYRQNKKNQSRQIRMLEQQKALQEQQLEINHLKDIVQGEERERVRIARELHDGIVSQLMGVRLHFKGALQYAGDQLPNRQDFDNTLQYLDDATKELRKTAHNLMPETVLQGGLIMALQTFCEKMAIASGIRIYFQHFGTDMPRDADVELSLYRIVQELVQNAIKHAHCTQVLVELIIEDRLLSIDVEDNGCGIGPDVLEQQEGMGLKSIYTRVKSLQGDIDISGKPGKGTTISMEFMV